MSGRLNACGPGFRPMVQPALLTGALYAVLATLEVRDYDPTSHTVWLRDTKAGNARVVYLEEEWMHLFEDFTFGKAATEIIFARPDGRKWGPSQQARRLATACETANLSKTSFHDLRRTYGARLALKGVQLAVIAAALDRKRGV